METQGANRGSSNLLGASSDVRDNDFRLTAYPADVGIDETQMGMRELFTESTEDLILCRIHQPIGAWSGILVLRVFMVTIASEALELLEQEVPIWKLLSGAGHLGFCDAYRYNESGVLPTDPCTGSSSVPGCTCAHNLLDIVIHPANVRQIKNALGKVVSVHIVLFSTSQTAVRRSADQDMHDIRDLLGLSTDDKFMSHPIDVILDALKTRIQELLEKDPVQSMNDTPAERQGQYLGQEGMRKKIWLASIGPLALTLARSIKSIDLIIKALGLLAGRKTIPFYDMADFLSTEPCPLGPGCHCPHWGSLYVYLKETKEQLVSEASRDPVRAQRIELHDIRDRCTYLFKGASGQRNDGFYR